MRLVIVLLLTAAMVATAIAQYPSAAYVELELPSDDCVIIIHPTRPAEVFTPDGNTWGSFDVRVGESPYDHWGDCWFDEPLLSAEALLVRPHSSIEGLVILEEPVPLDSPPATDGWTTVDFANLHGGGHSDGPLLMFATVPDHSPCYLYNSFSITLRSADITGDLLVDLSDIVFFTQALAEYRAYADLRPDGVINLSDIVVMAQGIFYQ